MLMEPIKSLIQTLTEKLQLKVTRSQRDITYKRSIPLGIKKSYAVDLLIIEGTEVVVLSTDELHTKGLLKHLDLFAEALDSPILLNVSQNNTQLQKFLLEKHIPFVMGNETIYMPQFLIWIKHLSFKSTLQSSNKKRLSKFSQMLIIYALINNKRELDLNSVATHFDMSTMSASRALSELEKHKLLELTKTGQKKNYHLVYPIEIDRLLSLMESPKKGEVFVKKDSLPKIEGLMSASYQALAYYSDLAAMQPEYAIEKARFPKEVETYPQAYDDDYIKIELWKYNPKAIAANGSDTVDPFSLYLSMHQERESIDDVRVNNALDTVYKQLKEVCSG
jgi:hypothetical protein